MTAVAGADGIGRRLAAIVALMGALVAVVLVVVGALSQWLALAVAVVGLLVVVNATWYVVARRGAARKVAAVAAAVGALVFVAGFAMADLSASNGVAILLVAAVAVGAARVALHRSAGDLRRSALAQSPVPPAQHPVLLINPKSGDGKAEKFRLVEHCLARGIEPVVLASGDDLAALAEAAIARGADVIGMAGGDGSQALVASIAACHGIAHVVVPAGTRNHFALDLGLDRTDVVGALDAYQDAVERRVDLATVNGRVFVNNASVGLYARIVQSADYREAKGGTTLEMLPELLGPGATPMDLRFTGPDGVSYPTAQVIMVSNNPYELHRLAGRFTRERLDGGVLGIVATRISNAREFSRFMALEAEGRARRFPGWLEWAAPRFRLDSDEPIDIGVDGEALTLDPPLEFETQPGALRVRVPRRAVGLSPTAKAVHVLSRTTIAELARVAAGRHDVQR